MSGHSKWANIKHKKAATDAKKGKIFSMLAKKISTAARRGGGDLEMNSELRLYVQKAKAANMPAANIERAILKATGQLAGQQVESFTYEGYGPGGVAFYLEGSTDNKNRTVSHVRHAFTKHHGNLGANGCVAWMFQTRGIVTIARDEIRDMDALIELAMEGGALDFELEAESISLTCAQEDFFTLMARLFDAGYTEFMEDEITLIAENSVTPALDVVRANLRLLELLEDDDDVESVYHNMNLSDEVAALL